MITGLQLSHLNVATMPHVVEKFQEGTKKKNLKLVNQHILIQINNLSVFLKEGKHSETRHLTPETPAELKIPKYLIPIQSAALSPRGRLYGLNGTFKLAALASGFEIVGAGGGEKYHWSKKLQTGSPTSLKLSRPAANKHGLAKLKTLSTFKKTVSKASCFEDDASELIDEDELVVEVRSLRRASLW